MSTSNDGPKPLRFDGNAGTTVTLNGNPFKTPRNEEGEKELVQELMHLPEKRPRKKWTHEETQNLVKGCNKVRHSVIFQPRTLPFPDHSPSEDPDSRATVC